MTRFFPGSIRSEKKIRGAKERFVHSFLAFAEPTRLGKFKLNSDGKMLARKKLQPVWEKRILRQKAIKRRSFRMLLKTIRTKPLRFKTTDGKKVVFYTRGFSNIYAGQSVPARALLLVLVDGRKLFFYRSSGENSQTPHVWYPTLGPELGSDFGQPMAAHMVKMVGHPNDGVPSHFPKWVSEISARIKKAENRLDLNENWSVTEYQQLLQLFERVPFTTELAVLG